MQPNEKNLSLTRSPALSAASEEPVELITNSSLAYYNTQLGDLYPGNPDAPLARYFTGPNISTGNPTANFDIEPNLASVSALQDWLINPEAAVENGNWSDLQVIPGRWTVNTETAIIYEVDGGESGFKNVTADFNIDNGILVWVNGKYKFGDNPRRFSVRGANLGNLRPGKNYIQVLRSDYGGLVGYSVNISGIEKDASTAGKRITGTPGRDSLRGSAGNDVISGLGGNDTILAGSGRDNVFSGDGNDRVTGGAGRDNLSGGAGKDRLIGGSDNDVLQGEQGRDLLIGGTGNDRLAGGDDNDVLRGGSGNDRIIGGTGNDVLRGDNDNDRLIGDAGDDLLQGGRGRDLLVGGVGNDQLDGGADNDVLQGGAGNDRMVGGTGDDRLIGGQGRDLFVLSTGLGTDIIQDFRKGMDKIELSGALRFGNISISQTSRNTFITFGNKTLAQLNGNISLVARDFTKS